MITETKAPIANQAHKEDFALAKYSCEQRKRLQRSEVAKANRTYNASV